MLKRLKNFFTGMASILYLDPRTTNIDPPKKLYKPHKTNGDSLKSDCDKCKGTGKITWIDKIVRSDKNGIK